MRDSLLSRTLSSSFPLFSPLLSLILFRRRTLPPNYPDNTEALRPRRLDGNDLGAVSVRRDGRCSRPRSRMSMRR